MLQEFVEAKEAKFEARFEATRKEKADFLKFLSGEAKAAPVVADKDAGAEFRENSDEETPAGEEEE